MGQALLGLASVGKALGWEGQEAVSTHLALQVCFWTCSRPTSWELARNAHPLNVLLLKLGGQHLSCSKCTQGLCFSIQFAGISFNEGDAASRA